MGFPRLASNTICLPTADFPPNSRPRRRLADHHMRPADRRILGHECATGVDRNAHRLEIACRYRVELHVHRSHAGVGVIDSPDARRHETGEVERNAAGRRDAADAIHFREARKQLLPLNARRRSRIERR
jgi:hypothetical protein